MEVVREGQRVHVLQAVRGPAEPRQQLAVLLPPLLELASDLAEDRPLVRRPHEHRAALADPLAKARGEGAAGERGPGVDPLRVLRGPAGRMDRVAAPLEGHVLVRAHPRMVRDHGCRRLEVEEVERMGEAVQDGGQPRAHPLAVQPGVAELHELPFGDRSPLALRVHQPRLVHVEQPHPAGPDHLVGKRLR